MQLQGRRVVVTGGTGSLGKCLVRRLLKTEVASVTVFSRDEAKQHDMRLEFQQASQATDEVIYRDASERLKFIVGDVRDYGSVVRVLQGADVVFNAAALKQVPTCEYFPWEAVQTNVLGPQNIVRAIRELRLPVDTVVGISTDKAVKPVNVMGMTKALQERVFITANLGSVTRYVCVRYGNVLASRGSVIPLFQDQIRRGVPVTITDLKMTRFLISLDQAVDTVLAAVSMAKPGEIYVPKIPSARMADLALAIIGNRDVELEITTIRPGEKLHEILISEEERGRVLVRDGYYVIQSMLPEIPGQEPFGLADEYSSKDYLLNAGQLSDLLKDQGLIEEAQQ